jgi:hypothetical protein
MPPGGEAAAGSGRRDALARGGRGTVGRTAGGATGRGGSTSDGPPASDSTPGSDGGPVDLGSTGPKSGGSRSGSSPKAHSGAKGAGGPKAAGGSKNAGPRPDRGSKTGGGSKADSGSKADGGSRSGDGPKADSGPRADGGRKADGGSKGVGRRKGDGGQKSNGGPKGKRGPKRDHPPGQDGGPQAPPAGGGGQADRERPRMPPVRLAPRDELAAAARVAPLLRAAADLSRWADKHQAAQPGGPAGRPAGAPMSPGAAGEASADLELTPNEVDAAWRVVVATGLLEVDGPDIGHWDDGEVLSAWDSGLAAILDAEDLDGLATALYTVGTPVRIDALFEAYTAAAGTPRPERDSPAQGTTRPPGEDEAGALSRALETLADLGVVELGTEEAAGGLTVTLSPLGVWGVHRRLRGQGWHVPVLGSADRDGAVGLLMTLANCDAEDGEAEIGTWLADRTPVQAARELIQAAAGGSPGLRGAAFAVLDRVGDVATAEIRAALGDPLLRAHAAVWLHEHDEEAELRPSDRTWLLVDLGAGLLEEADPRDVVAELLPEVPALAQAEIVAGLWQVDHPGVIDLLTALSEHHPDPSVARAARKAAFKARSPGGAALGPA